MKSITINDSRFLKPAFLLFFTHFQEHLKIATRIYISIVGSFLIQNGASTVSMKKKKRNQLVRDPLVDG